MSNTTTEQPSQPQPIEIIQNPYVLGISLTACLLFLLIFDNGKYKGDKVEGARFANRKDIGKAKRLGHQQIRKGKHNKAALALDSRQRWMIPNAQQSLSFVGGSGYGKTVSGVDPCITSAIEQGWTGLIYDVKGELMRKHAANAIRHGYQIYCFAPGFDYSGGLNILDFMDGPLDSAMAFEIASVLNANLQPPGSKPDAYFSPNGDALLRALFMMAKGSTFRDMLTAWELLRLPDLATRLAHADQNQNISPWVASAATGLISVTGSAETVAGIVGSATTNFGKLVDPQLVPCLLKTTIPLHLPGKQLVFFQIDERRQAATSPLVAVAIHMLVTKNLNATVKRDRPFLICIDEFPTIKLPNLEKWINLNRSYGQSIILGYQSQAQIKQRYDNYIAQAIEASIGTKVIFNPGVGNHEIAKQWAESCGMKRIKVESHSRSRGKQRNKSVSVQPQRKPLIASDEIQAFEPGEALLMNSIYGHPVRIKFPYEKRRLKRQDKDEQLWFNGIQKRLIEMTHKQLMITDLDNQVINHRFLAEYDLPHPSEFEAQN